MSLAHDRWVKCPRQFCFNWANSGDGYAPGFHADEDAALAAAKPVSQSGCLRRFGVRSRENPAEGVGDHYEPCEPELDPAKLPHDWFTRPMPS